MTYENVMLGRGDTLAGFVIEDVLGVGGMAIVYRAEQASLRRRVALKVLSPELNEDPEFRERFRREGQHVAALDHPNIVTIFDSGEMDGRLYLAMRLIDGTTLATRLKQTGLSVPEAVAILRPIAEALDTAHAMGLVHRDVKPQNILLSEGGVPYLTDFGVALLDAGGPNLTSTGSFIGSINYAAPEQVLGEPPTAATDVYALAAVMYQCLVGEVPFPRDTEVAAMRAHLEEPPPRVSDPPDSDISLNAIIARGLAKDPAHRYRRASELIADVAAATSTLSPSQRDKRPAFRRLDESPAAAELTISRVALLREAPPEGPAALGVSASVPAEAAASRETVRRPRQTAPATPPPEPVVTPGRLEQLAQHKQLLGAVALVAVAAIAAVGVVVATAGGAHSRDLNRLSTASSGALRLRFGGPWKVSTGSAEAASLIDQPIVLRSGATTLVAGAESSPPKIPGALPSRLDSPVRVRAAVGHLGPLPVAVYQWQGAHGAATEAWVVPTMGTDFLLLCQAAATPKPATTEGCARVVRTATLANVQTLQAGPDTNLGTTLNHVIAPVASARKTLRGLNNPHLEMRAHVASGFAQLVARAASSIKGLAVPSRYRALTHKISGALATEAKAFSVLSEAARKGRRPAYTAATQRAQRASRRLTAMVKAGAAYSLALATLSPLHLPGLPPAEKRVGVTVPNTTPITATGSGSSTPSVGGSSFSTGSSAPTTGASTGSSAPTTGASAGSNSGSATKPSAGSKSRSGNSGGTSGSSGSGSSGGSSGVG